MSYHSLYYYAAQVLANIRGGGMSSRLFQEVREKRGLCYSVYAFHWAFSDTGLFGIHAATGAEDLEELVNVIIGELGKATQRIDQQEIDHARAQVRAQLLMAKESPAARAGQLARQIMLFGKLIPSKDVLERLAAITPDRLTDLSERLFFSGKPTVSAIGPLDKMASATDILSSLSRRGA